MQEWLNFNGLCMSSCSKKKVLHSQSAADGYCKKVDSWNELQYTINFSSLFSDKDKSEFSIETIHVNKKKKLTKAYPHARQQKKKKKLTKADPQKWQQQNQ